MGARQLAMIAVAVPALWWAGSQAAHACLWDRDTIAMEVRRFPTAADLIAGKFLRHSEDYYRWRIRNRTARLDKDPSDLASYDDLAVAFDKLGQHAEAIAVMQRKEAVKGGMYETYANLGTFHIHNSELKKGLEFISKAIDINPDAHFGREIVQKALVQYVIVRRQTGRSELPLSQEWFASNGSRLPYPGPAIAADLAAFEARPWFDKHGRAFVDTQVPHHSHEGFARFAVVQHLTLEQARKGLLGMMKFGKFDSPLLLEALGDVLLEDRNRRSDAAHLAAMAYLRAAQGASNDKARALYRAKAVLALVGKPGATVAAVEKELQRRQRQAARYVDRIAARERRWIERGVDVDEAFARAYYEGKSRDTAE